MKIAIVGSRKINIDNIGDYIPKEATTIISGGARGVDTCAAKYARENGLELIEYLPDYEEYGRGAPLVRNDKIIEAADKVIAIWDGVSRGTRYVIKRCREEGKEVEVIRIEVEPPQPVEEENIKGNKNIKSRWRKRKRVGGELGNKEGD